MAFLGSQVALNASTPTALWSFTGAGKLSSPGSLQDPIPAALLCTAPIYLGPSGVTTSTGLLLPGDTVFPLTFFGTSEILYALAQSGTPTAQLLFGRQ